MPRSGAQTRRHIVDTANSLFYRKGIRATSLDAIADKAGVTKRTVYYHFQSKDDLIAEYLASRDQPNLEAFQHWFDAREGTLADKVKAIFTGIAATVSHPKWRGCGFQRTVGELADKPGHPAVKIASAHKKRVEEWLAAQFERHGLPHPRATARQVGLLLEGAFAAALIHQDADYVSEAGNAAGILLRGA